MMEEEQKEHVAKLNKMEREMEEVFERKVLINLIFLPSSKNNRWSGSREEAKAVGQRARPGETAEREHNEATAAEKGA